MDFHLPAINRSHSNLRPARVSEAEIMDRLAFLSKRVMDLEAVISQKNREIAKIEVTNRNLSLGNQKRDEIIAAALAENRKLKEKLRWANSSLAKFQKDQEVSAAPEQPLPRWPSYKDLSKSLDAPKSNNVGRLAVHDEKLKAKLYQSLLEDDGSFIDRFSSMEPQSQSEFLELLRTRQKDYKSLVELTLRLKRLILASYNISVSLMLNDAVDRFVHETCENLRCERASVFLVDELNEELWTKAASGTNNTIRTPLNQGLVGHVAQTGKPLNIEDAYKDPRFNRTVDQQTNYKTRSMLVIPVRDSSGRVIGVCQAINKSGGIFTSDDEALFEMLASNAGVMLRNALLNEASLVMEERIRALAGAAVELFSGTTLASFQAIALKCGMGLIGSSDAIMYLTDGNSLFQVSKSGVLERKDLAGLAGHCVSTAQIMNITDAYSDALFNPHVDISTSMPVIVLPASARGKVVAVFEVVNPRGVLGRAVKRKAKLDPVDNQVLGYFADIVAAMLETLFPQRFLTTPFEVLL
jgi:putative methionine-R-sulfoxide reductase with GAF domain